ncbi:hypothetical protein PlfCFBP13513_08595 [Plantibacter flavus]|uniref:hypothetical protein n=1 Tax=Plantibacter flavus TaxID=150123 RepID=UPI0010C19CCF|nr:hypothetical protein [Plantibacter flavus]TKJ99426.1 hypothetical protein PlfCFBP13513_08595 [Plantibacter flavus]
MTPLTEAQVQILNPIQASIRALPFPPTLDAHWALIGRQLCDDGMGMQTDEMTLIVEMMRDSIEESVHNTQTISLLPDETFELGALPSAPPKKTYAPFLSEFGEIADHLPAALLQITLLSDVKLLAKPGKHSRGMFDFFLDDVPLLPDPDGPWAVRFLERRKSDGFVLRMALKSSNRVVRVTGRYGATARITKTKIPPMIEVLRAHLVPSLQRPTQASFAVAIALHEYETGVRLRLSDDAIVSRVEQALVDDIRISDRHAATRHAFEKVYVWIRGRASPVRDVPANRASWAQAIAFAKLDALALDDDDAAEPARFVEYRSRNTVAALVQLARALVTSGALTADDLAIHLPRGR